MSMLMSGSGKAARIPLHELKYWSVERQEPYVDAEASFTAAKA